MLLLAARLALGLAYSQVVPAWESYDEDGHFAYARYLALHHSLTLPAADPEAGQIWEKFQPPLYYDLIAPVIAIFDRGAPFVGPERNPYFANGNAGVNYAVRHDPLTDAGRSIELALRAARIVGVVISTLSVIAVFFTAQRLWPREAATVWTATLLYAFWPQFVFLGSMVTNDVLITALSAAALWLAVDLALDGFRLWPALALSALVGAALLTKLNGAALIVLIGGALILSLRPSRGPLKGVTRGRLLLGLGGLALLIGIALWTLSSLSFVTRQVFQLAILRDLTTNLAGSSQSTGRLIAAALAYAFRTFLASYGWGNVETFNWLYGLWTLGALLAVAGFGFAVWGRRRARAGDGPPAQVYLLLAAFILALLSLALALAVAQNSIYLVPGRYLLPALPAVVLLLVGGWRAWLPAIRARRQTWQAISLGLILVVWATPFQILAPAYAIPAPETARQLTTPIGVVFGDSLELMGSAGAITATAGDSLQATLCWQAIAPVPSDHTLFLEVVGADGQGYGRFSTYPGHGNYPTSQWRLNTPFCEPYQVQLGEKIPAPALAHLRVAWLAGTSGQPLPLRLLSGQALNDTAYGIEFKVSSPPGLVPPIAHAVNYRLGQQISLTGYEAVPTGSQVRVTLRWQALQDVTGDYVVFTHLRDRPDHAYTQGDGLPVQGAYPTRLWQKGEVVLDSHLLNLPPGSPTPPLALVVGMVDAVTQKRLSVYDANGHEVTNDEILLAQGLTFP